MLSEDQSIDIAAQATGAAALAVEAAGQCCAPERRTVALETTLKHTRITLRSLLFPCAMLSVPLIINVLFPIANASSLDRCFADRSRAPKPGPLRDLVALFTHFVFLLASTSVRSEQPRSSSWAVPLTHSHLSVSPRGILCYLLSYSWFYTTYMWLAVVRELIADDSCGRPGKHNSISGHFYLYPFMVVCSARSLFSTLRDYSARIKLMHQHDEIVGNSQHNEIYLRLSSVLAWFFNAWLSALVLYQTMAHGYHSPRQMIFGLCIAIASDSLLQSLLLRFSCTANPFPLSATLRRSSVVLPVLFLLGTVVILALTPLPIDLFPLFFTLFSQAVLLYLTHLYKWALD